jgi:hypothetical protein
VLLVDHSTRISSSVGAPICLTGSALQPDRVEVQAEVECDLIKKEPHFIVVDLLIVGYLLEELIASQLLRLIMLILQASLFKSHQGLTRKVG